MRIRRLAAAAWFLAAVLLWWPDMAESDLHQLRVASVPERVFLYFANKRLLPDFEGFLDDTRRSRFVVLNDRRPQALEIRGPGEVTPLPVNIVFPKRSNPWGPTTWDGEPGQLALFRVRGIHSNYQKLKYVAVHTGGGLTRFPVRSVTGSQTLPMQVPATATDYLTHALESGTFPAWVERRAVSHEGLSVIVGRHQKAQESDTVYLMVRMSRARQVFKVILGWETIELGGSYANIQGIHK